MSYKEKIRNGLNDLWSSIGGDPCLLEKLEFCRSGNFLPSAYDVSSLASCLAGGTTLAVAELHTFRKGNPESFRAEVDGLEASAAFRSEALLSPIGWEIPPPWDPIAGDYRTRDGWIRLHTNYLHHKRPVIETLNLNPEVDKQAVANAVADWNGEDLEEAVVRNGGCAARMQSESGWASDPRGSFTLDEPIVHLQKKHLAEELKVPDPLDGRPLSGIKVLDLTRVIAGPECSRILSAWGADVLRLDPPEFDEVPAVIPDVTIGKRCAFLDLNTQSGAEHFKSLIREAHVLVLGYRSGALDRFGITLDSIYQINPALIVGRLNAYGWSGPLRERRGFDSLVQMSVGIAARGAEAFQKEKPVPLPAQALDHGAGFALAAGICRALIILWSKRENHLVSASLVGTANFLKKHFRMGELASDGSSDLLAEILIEVSSDWGRLKRTVNPGLINGVRGEWQIPAGTLGRHEARF